MEAKKFGDWVKAERILGGFGTRLKVRIDRTNQRTAKKLVKSMVTGITQKRFKLAPLAESTVRRKGSSTPLVDLGDLVGSITDRRVSWDTSFAGVLRQARNRRGGKLVNIAAIHVFGLPVRTGGRLKIIKRDFITPAVKEMTKDYQMNIMQAVGEAFRG